MSEYDDYGHLIERSPEISETEAEQLEADLERDQDARDRMWDSADHDCWETP